MDAYVDYLARYTHRIAISNARILDIDAKDVSLRYTDYRDHDRTKVLRLEGEEFVHRFLLHILPKDSCACVITASWPTAADGPSFRASAAR
jgi:hypothetical protein